MSIELAGGNPVIKLAPVTVIPAGKV